MDDEHALHVCRWVHVCVQICGLFVRMCVCVCVCVCVEGEGYSHIEVNKCVGSVISIWQAGLPVWNPVYCSCSEADKASLAYRITWQREPHCLPSAEA